MCDLVGVMDGGSLVQIGTPEASYQAPQSKFVAEFVTQANFLPGRWENNGWQTEIGWFKGNEIPDRDCAQVMISQAGLQPVTDPTSQIKVGDRQFLGREYRYWLVTPNGQSIYARTPIDVDLPTGTGVRLEVASSESIRVFPIDI